MRCSTRPTDSRHRAAQPGRTMLRQTKASAPSCGATGSSAPSTFSWQTSQRSGRSTRSSAAWTRKTASGDDRPVARRATPRAANARIRVAATTGTHGHRGHYSVELLVPLHEHYRIDLVTDQKDGRSSGSARRVCRYESFEWFDAHAAEYDRTALSNRQFTVPSPDLDLLDRNPGTVVRTISMSRVS